MRTGRGLRVEPGAPLLIAAVWFFFGWRLVLAVLAAALFHELGHLAALGLTGERITGFRAQGSGFVIETVGPGTRLGAVLTALAGPAFGAALAVAAAAAGHRHGGGFLLTVSGVSAALTAFNLLPALPLDGGRVVEAMAGPKTASGLGLAVSAGTLLLGLIMLIEGYGWALLWVGAWLTLYQAGL